MDLMQALEAKRKESGLTVERFAASLGISREHYHKLLAGRPPGDKVRAAALRAYPELADVVLGSLQRVA